MKNIVLVHDSFTQLGGAERVVQAFCELFPDAPLYALVADKFILSQVTDRECRTSYLQNLFEAGVPFKYMLPLLAPATGSLSMPENSIILSSSSLFLKGLIVPKSSQHIQYIHTPPRFLWTDPEYVSQEVPKLLRPFASVYLKQLKKWDVQASKKVTQYIANSKEVQARVKNFYGLDSKVIYPFVDLDFWKPTKPKADFFLMGGRLQQHKHYEDILQAVDGTNVKIKIIGSGRFSAELEKYKSENIEFLGRVTDEELRDLYSSAIGFIFPPVEDAGMMPLEAAGCGTATLGIRKGGSLETIIEGITGEFLESYEKEHIKQKLLNWNSAKYSVDDLQNHAKKFSKERFKNEILNYINTLIPNS